MKYELLLPFHDNGTLTSRLRFQCDYSNTTGKQVHGATCCLKVSVFSNAPNISTIYDPLDDDSWSLFMRVLNKPSNLSSSSEVFCTGAHTCEMCITCQTHSYWCSHNGTLKCSQIHSTKSSSQPWPNKAWRATTHGKQLWLTELSTYSSFFILVGCLCFARWQTVKTKMQRQRNVGKFIVSIEHIMILKDMTFLFYNDNIFWRHDISLIFHEIPFLVSCVISHHVMKYVIWWYGNLRNM